MIPKEWEGLNIYHVFMGEISKTVMFDFLPLDWALHVLFSVFIIWCFHKYKNGILWSFLVSLSLALFKEWLDSHALKYTFEEGLGDVLATIFLPSFLLLQEGIKKIKRREE